MSESAQPQPSGPGSSRTFLHDRRSRIGFVLIMLAGLIIPLLSLNAVWTLRPNGISYASGALPEWDFANLWAGGTLARQGELATLFDAPSYRQWFLDHVGADGLHREWSYPPNILLLAVPFAHLPLFAAYLLWGVAGLALLWLILRAAEVPLPIMLATVFGPGALTNLFFAQTGALAGGLFLGALLLVGRRQRTAGALAGLLSVKPQFGLLLPISFLAARRWRAIAVAAATIVVTALAASLLFGWEVYPLYFLKTAPLMRDIMEAPFPQSYQANGITVFLTARATGAGIPLAYVIQSVAAIAAIVVSWRLWSRPCAHPLLRIGATGCWSLLATPYGYAYDMVVFTFACAVMFDQARWRFRPALLLCWFWPSVSPFVNSLLFPVTPFVIVLAAIVSTLPLLQERGSVPQAAVTA